MFWVALPCTLLLPRTLPTVYLFVVVANGRGLLTVREGPLITPFYLLPSRFLSSAPTLCAISFTPSQAWQGKQRLTHCLSLVPATLFALGGLDDDQAAQKRLAKERVKREQEKKLAKMLGFKGRGRGRRGRRAR